MAEFDKNEFEARFERRLRAFSAIDVPPVDADAVANSVSGRRVSRSSPLPLLAAAVVVIALLLTMLFIVSGGPKPLPLTGLVTPAPGETPNEATADPSPAASTLAGLTWLADQPVGFAFDGEVGARRMSLSMASDGMATVRVGPIARDQSTFTPAGDELVLRATAAGSALTRDGETVAGCAPGDEGRYRWSVSDDGLLTLTRIEDACPTRAAVLERAWARSLTADSSGGRGVVDAFAPPFAATLPETSFTPTRSSDAVEIWAADGNRALLAWKDPQGFVDACDEGAGRYEVAPGADAFVAYFRQNPAFTVVSADELQVDGHRAVHLVVDARKDHPCPAGFAVEWQPKAETSALSWHLAPGGRDSLYIVELPAATVMVEVLGTDSATETAIVDSLRFLDQVPPGP